MNQCHFWQMNFDVLSVLHTQYLSLAAANQIYVFHEVMNGCKTKDSLIACLENVNINSYLVRLEA